MESPKKFLKQLQKFGKKAVTSPLACYPAPRSDEQILIEDPIEQRKATFSYSFMHTTLHDSFHDIVINRRLHDGSICDENNQNGDSKCFECADDSTKCHLGENSLNSLFGSIESARLSTTTLKGHSSGPNTQPYIELIRDTIKDKLCHVIADDDALRQSSGTPENASTLTYSLGVTDEPETGAHNTSNIHKTGVKTVHNLRSTKYFQSLVSVKREKDDETPLIDSSSVSDRLAKTFKRTLQVLQEKGRTKTKATTTTGENKDNGDTSGDSCFGCSPFLNKQKNLKNNRKPRLRREGVMCGPGSSGIQPGACCTWDHERDRIRRNTSEILESTRIDEVDPTSEDGTPFNCFIPNPTPVLEICEREAVYTGTSQPKMYQPYKGQLKVSVKVNYGILTIHIIQARHLSSSRKSTCDSYVKMSLIPGSSKRTRHATTLVYDTNHPVYDERFSYELMEGDIGKRVCISMWHRDFKTNSIQQLGSMSFGIRSITANTVIADGWYYLLSDHLGNAKHLRVTDQPLLQPFTTDPDTHKNKLPTVAKEPADNELQSVSKESQVVMSPSRDRVPVVAMTKSSDNSLALNRSGSRDWESGSENDTSSVPSRDGNRSYVRTVPITTPQILTLPIMRGRHGYGLSLTGACPTQISRVEAGSPAERVGFEAGDLILRVNNQPVHKMPSDAVGRVIRHYPRCILLEVLRAPTSEPVTVCQPVPYSQKLNGSCRNSVDSSFDSSDDDDDDLDCYESAFGSNSDSGNNPNCPPRCGNFQNVNSEYKKFHSIEAHAKGTQSRFRNRKRFGNVRKTSEEESESLTPLLARTIVYKNNKKITTF